MVIVIKLCPSPSDGLPGHFGQTDQAVESVCHPEILLSLFCPWFLLQIKTRSPMSSWKASKFPKRPRTFSPVRPWKISSRNMTTLRKECQVCEISPKRLSVDIIYSAFVTFTYLGYSSFHLTSHFVAFITDDAIKAILPHEDIKLFKLIMGCKFSVVSLAWLLDWTEHVSVVFLAWLLDWMNVFLLFLSLDCLIEQSMFLLFLSLDCLIEWIFFCCFSCLIAWLNRACFCCFFRLIAWLNEYFSVVSFA